MNERLIELEKKKKKVRNSIIISGVLFALSILSFAISFAIVYKYPHGVLISGLLFIIAIACFIYNISKQKAVIIEMKNTFMVDNIKEIFTYQNYYPDGNIDKERIFEKNLVAKGNSFECSDKLEFSYKDIDFSHVDVKSSTITSNGKTTTETIHFNGRIISCKIPKSCGNRLYINERGFDSNKVGFKRYEEIELENIEFNKNFRTFSSDGVFAFKVITPIFMEKLSSIQSKVKGKLTVGVVNDELYILVFDGKNNFEPTLSMSFDEYNNLIKHHLIETRNLLDIVIELINLLV